MKINKTQHFFDMPDLKVIQSKLELLEAKNTIFYFVGLLARISKAYVDYEATFPQIAIFENLTEVT